jgi:hypothetical protein
MGVMALLKGVRKGYQQRQINQYNTLEWGWQAARTVRDNLVNTIKQNPGGVPTKEQAAQLDQYQKALDESADKLHTFTMPKASTGGNGKKDPAKQKLQNVGNLLKRMLLGPKISFPQFPGGSVPPATGGGTPNNLPPGVTPFSPAPPSPQGGAPSAGSAQVPSAPPPNIPPTPVSTGGPQVGDVVIDPATQKQMKITSVNPPQWEPATPAGQAGQTPRFGERF